MGMIRGASTPQLLALCKTAAVSQGIAAATATQIAPVPTAQINKNSILNSTTGVFTPLVTGYYRVSGVLLCSTGAGVSSVYVYIYQGGTQFAAIAGAANVSTNSIPVLTFSNVLQLTGGQPYHLRFFSSVINTIIELQLAIEYVSP